MESACLSSCRTCQRVDGFPWNFPPLYPRLPISKTNELLRIVPVIISAACASAAGVSHSASVGRRYFLPSFRLNQSQNATASFHETLSHRWSPSVQPGAHGQTLSTR